MKVLSFLSLLLLVSFSDSRTAKTKLNLTEDEELVIYLEQAVTSESAEESDTRRTFEVTDGEVDLDTNYSYDDEWDVRQDLIDEVSRPILLKELDIMQKRSSGQHEHGRYDGERYSEATNTRHNSTQRSPKFDADDLMDVTQHQLGGTKTLICDNLLDIYPTIFVNVDDTAAMYSPMFLQEREYPNNSNCGWRFETSGSHRLTFNCSEFDVREGDYLSLRDDYSSKLERFSGGRKLNHITKMNNTFVVFYSNEKESGRGFNCSVTSVRESSSVDDEQVVVEPSCTAEKKPAATQSLVTEPGQKLTTKAKLPAIDHRISPPVEFISDEVSENVETRKYESLADLSDSASNKATVEKLDEGGSIADEGRLTFLKIETTRSSMHAGVYSSKVVRTVVDAMGSLSIATRTLVNSTRVVGITTNAVEKREDGGGALFTKRRAYDPTRANLPGHATTSVLESNMSSEVREKTEFVSDDLTGERHQEHSSFTKKSSSESTEIKSSRKFFPEEFAKPTPPL